MDVPHHLIQQIQDGKSAIFLGAGASLSAKDAKGNSPPTGKKLGEMLSDKFLGGKFRDGQLTRIAELAISESDLIQVQEFIKDIVEPFQPSPSHLLLSQFRWAGIATTNYDRLIEKTYESNPSALQMPKPFIEDGDRVEDSMRDPQAVMLLKLHGCVTRLSNPHCPLILTTDQYITHRRGRGRIFDHLRNWAYELPLVFIGSSVQDPDIRAVLLELTNNIETRPRYYLVAPKIDDIEARFWGAKRITTIIASFEEFMAKLNGEISPTWRALTVTPSSTSHPIKERFAQSGVVLSRNCIQFLESDVDYVKSVTATESVEPRDFYKGHNKEWSAIEQKLDVRRILGDTILTDEILEDEANKPKGLDFVLIKAHAGAGKTILLRRIAWDAAHDYDALCLYLKQSGWINTAALQEIITVCKERVFLFVDDAADRMRELQSLVKNIEQFGKHLTIIATERVNEWNISSSAVAQHVTNEYELEYLTNFEIDKLLNLLSTHKALGTLGGKTIEEQRSAFREMAGRQLLVALHEATLGKPFEDIIEDEFRNIVPTEAQNIYLSICVLNRLGVPVRAGIIARLHGIRFEEFKERLFKPLEHVVSTVFDNVIRDYMYSARHPFIAEIVFDRVLKQQEERYDLYLKCLNTLNVDYGADRKAFRQMIRGRVLIDLFPNPDLVKDIYDAAAEIIGEDDGSYYHQRGLYEMHRGNHQAAGKLFAKAESLAPYDFSIKHSRSELLLKTAEHARTSLEKDKLLKEAAQIAITIKNSRVVAESHAYHTLVKIGLEKLGSLLISHKDSQQVEIEAVVKNIEKNLDEGLQQFPGDSYLLTAESRFADLLNDSERVISSLQKAFEANPRTSFIAVRLAAHFRLQNNQEKAAAVLEKALNANRNDRSLHYHFAKHLMQNGSQDGDQLAYHLQRAFSPGDTNYDAQLLYGRQLHINGDREGAKLVFDRLKEAKIAPELKSRLLYPMNGVFYGTVVRIEGNYLYLNKDGTNEWTYAHRSNIEDAVWMQLIMGTRCRYKIAFNLHGPGASDLQIAQGVDGDAHFNRSRQK